MSLPQSSPALYLASASPRRRELLRQIGVVFEIVRIDYHEHVHPGELPENYVRRVALEKAREGFRHISEAGQDGVVLGADTAVIVDDHILGKPVDQRDAVKMLQLLSNREHQVLSGVALVNSRTEKVIVQESQVRMRQINDDEIAEYWDSGEPVDKAGAYAVQGLGAVFIEHIAGSYSGIMGLPVFETAQLLNEFGIRTI